MREMGRMRELSNRAEPRDKEKSVAHSLSGVEKKVKFNRKRFLLSVGGEGATLIQRCFFLLPSTHFITLVFFIPEFADY